MRINFDFTAAPGAHFGPKQTIDELLAEIPNPIDFWEARPENLTITDGKVSAWTGKLGRQFVQANAARRPTYTADGLRMGNAAGDGPEAFLSLAGAQIGPAPALAIATRIRLPPAALTQDLHYLWAGSVPILRLTYRYTNSNNYLRANILGAANSLDVDLPAGQETIGAVLVADGPAVSLHLPGGATASFAAAGDADFANLFIGSGTGAAAALNGWQQRFGMWRHVPDAEQLATLLKWVG
ncbi:hypothetical protein QWZ10_20025 [Paracoccus cavernae]|uniref:Uncharacterized protein n=1 Tax=Paracoccus cavernae TaxID=1571207 RepID=A0ABT8DC84_9RHOB|nr:hypothetical protein [Paracoccus cavernae]